MSKEKFEICIVTSTRADFGLLSPLMNFVKKSRSLSLRIAVTGTHLLEEFGNTITEIRQSHSGSKIDEIPIFNQAASNVEQIAATMVAFEKYFNKTAPDMVVVLGDRFEIFAVAVAAYALRIPIAHIHGGETSAGTLDEAYRHAITKMSYLHFSSCELHRNRIIAMGEEPGRVFNVGAIGLENILKLKLPKSKDLLKELGIPANRPYILATFHPATIEGNIFLKQIAEVFSFFDSLKNIIIIITKSNADTGGLEINKKIDEYVRSNQNSHAFSSLGIVNYLALMKDCIAVVGNSSSGIIEAPAFKVPTINIGDRQKGRLTCDSVVNCACVTSEIKEAFQKIQSNEFLQTLKTMANPFGNGEVSGRIVEKIESFLLGRRINLKKSFYDGGKE